MVKDKVETVGIDSLPVEEKASADDNFHEKPGREGSITELLEA